MKSRNKSIKMIGVGLGLWTLTACGILQTSVGTSNKKFASFINIARLEAQKLASVRPAIHQGMALYDSCEIVSTELNESVHQRWIQQKAGMSDTMIYALSPQNNTSGSAGPVDDSVSSPEASTGTATSSSKDSAETLTNVQEVGVDEADRFRVGRDQIYSLSFDQIKVVDRASLQLQGTLDASTWYSPQMFTRDDRLIIVGQTRYSADDPVPAGQGKPAVGAEDRVSLPYPGGWGMGAFVQIAIYRTAPGQMPVLLTQSKIEGSYIDSRMVQNQVVLVLRDQIQTNTVPVTFEDFASEDWYQEPRARAVFEQYFANSQRETEVKIVDDTLNGIPCSRIVNRKVSDWDFSLSKVLSFDIQNDQGPAQSLGIIGQGDKIYMTSESLYLLKYQITWFGAEWGAAIWYGSAHEKLLIQQIGFDGATGALTPLADGEVRGRIKDRWALHSMNAGNNLAIATSTGQMWGPEEQIAQNHLFLLERDPIAQRLNVVGSVENYGTREDIRSVRYVGNTAYVVTFRTTDPLFAFDITDPKAPKLLSGLKVPGFSTYMHPLADGRLLGVGFSAFDGRPGVQGVQVSLFDTTDPTAMSRLDSRLYGASGSNSEVTVDHHAFFHDPATQLIGLPLVELYGNSGYGINNLKFSGAQILAFENNLLVEKARVSHREWIPLVCQQQMSYGSYLSFDINRLYRVDNRILTLSQYGVKAFSLTDFTQPLASLQYQTNTVECGNSYPIAF